MSFTYKVRGLESLLSRIERNREAAPSEVDNVLRMSALRIERLSKQNAPVDTGYMRNGIFMEREGSGKFKVTSPAGYSVYVELGTRKMSPQPFLGPAVRQERPVLLNKLNRMFRR